MICRLWFQPFPQVNLKKPDIIPQQLPAEVCKTIIWTIMNNFPDYGFKNQALTEKLLINCWIILLWFRRRRNLRWRREWRCEFTRNLQIIQTESSERTKQTEIVQKREKVQTKRYPMRLKCLHVQKDKGRIIYSDIN